MPGLLVPLAHHCATKSCDYNYLAQCKGSATCGDLTAQTTSGCHWHGLEARDFCRCRDQLIADWPRIAHSLLNTQHEANRLLGLDALKHPGRLIL